MDTARILIWISVAIVVVSLIIACFIAKPVLLDTYDIRHNKNNSSIHGPPKNINVNAEIEEDL